MEPLTCGHCKVILHRARESANLLSRSAVESGIPYPHIHALVSEGVFLPDGTFVPLPNDLFPGPKRNFQIFDPLDFLAEVTQHIPEQGEHLIRYDGWYSNKKRGQRAKRQPEPAEGDAASPRPPSAREARKRWAALIKQVYETNPLACPKCGSEMKIIAFIERHQGEVIEEILRHCGLWEEAPARTPPFVPELAVG